jgi:hypothetical protein
MTDQSTAMLCRCGCGQKPARHGAEYVRGHRPPSDNAGCRKECAVEDCVRPVGRRGARSLCPRHYQQWQKTGSPTGTLRTPAIDRFMSRVAQNGDCWTWTGGDDGDGYGMFSDKPKYRWIVRTHRWAYEFFIVEIPSGLDLDHLCHNADPLCPGGPTCPHRRCVNPWHLEPVPAVVNVQRGAHTRYRPACPAGHEYSPANTYINPLGRRTCRTCRQESRARYATRRAA